ncbi:glycosyltransferase [candidate division KSB3 bacterium]|uniref:Glycosyltransferase n=1 Tax=candidate division KSB3 bacterium TaxID=2044937 RepID=A0A9D5JWU3_9BACT|nr:glycosyltransferase [candidate division KSB3 bacterium]MBD3325578.1 glycosyltransferase [candidate division KSB3 bacterium]
MVTLILILYCVAVGLLTVYGLNCHVLIRLFKRRLNQHREDDRRLLERFYRDAGRQALPVVTSQIPIFNEMNVAERVIDAIAAFDYPPGKHEIQVLDDSTDETSEIVAQKVKALRTAGVWIEHIRRPTRDGFKAGALKLGAERAHGEFLAIFDADFVPPSDFLLQAIPFFVVQPDLGLVQGRWGHINHYESVITWCQAIGIDGHFTVEQSARNWNDLFMNFNGTAGIFRKAAIFDVGSWNADTLTEDLDLSYRLQLAGWKSRYLIDLVAPAEIPNNIHAFKSQQFRWAKGSMQTALKLLPAIWKTSHPRFKKFEATLHLTHYLVHPLMLYLAVIAPSLLIYRRFDLPLLLLGLLGSFLLVSFLGPSRLYWTAGKYLYGKQMRRVVLLPFLICFGCGMAINNTRAVVEAILDKQSEFVRTPKRGHQERKHYIPSINPLFLLELVAGVWCLVGVGFYFTAHQYLVGHFLLIYAVGFLYVGGLSVLSQIRGVR